MSVTFADGRESVSAQCLGPEAYTIFTRPPTACRNRRFPRRHGKPLSDARTQLADFFSILTRVILPKADGNGN